MIEKVDIIYGCNYYYSGSILHLSIFLIDIHKNCTQTYV